MHALNVGNRSLVLLPLNDHDDDSSGGSHWALLAFARGVGWRLYDSVPSVRAAGMGWRRRRPERIICRIRC